MLRYLACGERRFGLHPMPPHVRSSWEFYAVVKGKIGPIFDQESDSPWQARHLWLFPPGNLHGWRGDGPRSAKIVAFHFGYVPAPLDDIVRRRGFHSAPLSAEAARRVVELELSLRPHYQQPNSFSNIHFDYALQALSLLVLNNLDARRLETSKATVLRKVDAALSWYAEHLTQRPKITEIAAAVHISASHLRRLFWEVRQESPQTAFSRLKMERAMHLMAGPDMKLETVAAGCGFSSASEFCRAFKQQHHVSPDVWRRTVLKPYDPLLPAPGRARGGAGVSVDAALR